MAHGGPDYWQYSTPQLPVPGIDQIPWVEEEGGNIAGGANAFRCSTLVPAGQRLYISGGLITTDFPRIQCYTLEIVPAATAAFYYDTVGQLPFNPSGLYVVNALETVRVRAFNLDALQHAFSVMLVGFLVTIIPGAPDPVGLGLLVTGAGV